MRLTLGIVMLIGLTIFGYPMMTSGGNPSHDHPCKCGCDTVQYQLVELQAKVEKLDAEVRALEDRCKCSQKKSTPVVITEVETPTQSCEGGSCVREVHPLQQIKQNIQENRPKIFRRFRNG